MVREISQLGTSSRVLTDAVVYGHSEEFGGFGPRQAWKVLETLCLMLWSQLRHLGSKSSPVPGAVLNPKP